MRTPMGPKNLAVLSRQAEISSLEGRNDKYTVRASGAPNEDIVQNHLT